MGGLGLRTFGETFRIDTCCDRFEQLVRTAFGAFVVAPSGPAAVRYRAWCFDGRMSFDGGDGRESACADHGELLYEFEKRFIIDLQMRRPDLLYVHGAVLAFHGRSLLLVAGSGTGKSTTALALLERGLGYLSDELAPIDLRRTSVFPFPQALCLKRVPPGRERFPRGGVRTSRSYRLPVAASHVPGEGLPLSEVYFLQRSKGRADAAVRPVSPAEAAVRLYPEVLNALAHPAKGLDAVVQLATTRPAYVVEMGTVEATADAILASAMARRMEVA